MSSKMFLSAFAAVAAVAVIASPQDPTFEYPAAKHVGFDVPKDDSDQVGLSDKVSVSFKNATVREVLDWLKNQGVNFVVGDDQVNKDSRININVMNQPVEQFMKALAGAWAGHWEKKEDIWVFRKGVNPFGEGSGFFTTDGDKNPFKILDGGAIKMDPKIYEGELGAQRKLSEAQRAELEKSLGKMDPKALEEFRKTWQDKAFQFKFDDKEMQKHFQEMEKNGQLFKLAPGQKGFIVDGKNFKPMDEKQMKEMEKHFQEMGKDGLFQHFKMDPNHKGFIVDGKNFKQFDEKQMKEMQKHFEEMEKSSAFQHFKIDPNQKGFIVDGKNFKPMDEKQMKELHKHLQEMEKSGAFQHFKMEPGQKGFSWGEDFKQLDGQQIKEMQKHFQEMGKDGFFKSFKIDPNQKGYIMDGKTQRPMTDKEMKTWRDKLEKAAKANAKGHPFTWNSEKSFFDGPNVSTSASAHNLKAIYDTLTPAQEQKLKRLGYINYSDLNSKQRNLLGVVTDESWTISYKTDKASLTIKSDR